MPSSWSNNSVQPGHAALGGQPAIPFPRVGIVNSYGDTSPIQTTPATYSRYGLIIAKNLATDPTTLRAAAPNAIILGYINSTQVLVNSVNSNGTASGTPTTAGLTIQPPWWLTYAGSLTTGPVAGGDTSIACSFPVYAYNAGAGGSGNGTAVHDWPTAPFPVLVSSQDRTVHEVMVCTSVADAVSGIYTLNVTRTLWNSTPQVFSAGARVAAIAAVPNFSNAFYLNVTPFCLKVGGLRWSDALVAYIQTQLKTFSGFNGPFIDSCNSYLNPKVNGADADMGNQVDPFGLSTNQIGGDGPTNGPITFNSSGVAMWTGSGRGVYNGILYVCRALRVAIPATNPTLASPSVILTNGSGYWPFCDGMFWENINGSNSFTSPPVAFPGQHRLENAYNVHSSDRSLIPATIINATVWTSAAGAATGLNTNAYSYNFATFRYALAMACLTNCFAAPAWYTSYHGQTWWFDEYDGAQGSSLTVAMASVHGAGTITVRNASRFAVGDVLRIPHAVKSTNYPTSYITRTEDELVTVTNVNTSTNVLSVTRNDAVNGTQIVGTAVRTDAQIAAGNGWLGYPLGAAVNNLGNLGAAVDTDSFETPSASGAVIAGTPTNWTFTANVNSLTQQGACFLDGTTSQSGSQCVRIDEYTPVINAGSFTYFQTKLVKSIAMSVPGGANPVPITVAFWAKGSRHQVMSLRILNSSSATLFTQVFNLTLDWAQYFMTFTPTVTDTGIKLQFEFGGEDGRYWMDNCQVFNGDPHIWSRQFTNGLVVMNGTGNNTNDTTHGQSGAYTLPAMQNGTGTAYTTYKRLVGQQDPSVNDGTTNAPGSILNLAAGDAIFLQKV